MLKIIGDKCLAEQTLSMNPYFYTEIMSKATYPIAVYIWQDGTSIIVRGFWDNGECYRQCEILGMPDLVIMTK